MVVDLQGSWKDKGCNMNVLSLGMISAGVPPAVSHTACHAFRKALYI